MKRPDPQARKVYAADAAIKRAYDFPEMALGEVQTLVDRAVKSRWHKARWPSLAAIKVFSGRGHNCSSSTAFTGGLKHVAQFRLNKEHRNGWDVMHELGHAVTDAEELDLHPEEREAKTWQDHGPEFCGNFVRLAGKWLGPKYATALRLEYRERGVIYVRRR